MGSARDRGNRWPVVASALGALALILGGLWLLLTHCPWFWVVVNGMLQNLASR